MQIFVTDPNPKQAAKWLDDKRVNKMIMESVQLLSCALYLNGARPHELPVKLGWQHHPLSKWTAKSLGNYEWVLLHLKYLLCEWHLRRSKRHAYEPHYNILVQLLPLIDDGPLHPFLNMTDKKAGLRESTEDIHTIYKRYLVWKWNTQDKHTPKWTNRTMPKWYNGRGEDALSNLIG